MTTKCVLQDWVLERPLMQQTVLIGAIRGPDGVHKHHQVKPLIRWYRRCVLKSAFDNAAIVTPYAPGGGNFTGPAIARPRDGQTWEEAMEHRVIAYLQSTDRLPHHYQCHFMHGVEIIGYHHSDARIRDWWCYIYHRLVRDLHLNPESKDQLAERLGDSQEGWAKHADISER